MIAELRNAVNRVLELLEEVRDLLREVRDAQVKW